MPRKSSNTNSNSSSQRGRSSSSSSTSSKSKNSMKYEIADEYGVELGANASARDNGKVGGEMTKRLVNKGKQSR